MQHPDSLSQEVRRSLAQGSHSSETFLNCGGAKSMAVKRKTAAQICMEKMLDDIYRTRFMDGPRGTTVDRRWVSEYQFAPPRKFRFDYAFIDTCGTKKVGIEIDGGIWTSGRHTRGAGYQKDLEKFNLAASMGFLVFRFSTQDVLQRKPMEFLR